MSGYREKTNTIEHDPTLRKNPNCKDCIHYNSEGDESGTCNKTEKIPRIAGFDIWKNCSDFKLSRDAYNYEEKEKRVKDRYGKKVSSSNTTVYKISKMKKNQIKELTFDQTSHKPYADLLENVANSRPKAIAKIKKKQK